MHSKTVWLRIAGTIFGIVSIIHLLRIITDVPVLIDGWLLPMWVNWMGFAATGFLSFWLWRFSFNYSSSTFKTPSFQTIKKIKAIYWILSGLFLCMTAIMCYSMGKNKDWEPVFLAGIAIVVAIIAMGFTDKKLPKFKGSVKLWTNKPPDPNKIIKNLPDTDDKPENIDQNIMGEEVETEIEAQIEVEYKVSIRIENTDIDPVTDIKIKIRTPHKITDVYPDKNLDIKIFRHGHTLIFFDDSFGILGNTFNKDYLHYDLKMKLGSWKHKNQGHFYLTINGSNIQTTTYIMTLEQIPELKIATEANSLKLEPLI